MIWEIDNVHSLAEFSVKHMMVTTVKGRFGMLSGSIEFDENNLSNGFVEATIDAASIDTREQRRDTHLRSADFLDVEHYPTITFKSKHIEKGDADDKYHVTGELTIHGVTREVVLQVTYGGTIHDPKRGVRAGFSAQTIINRKDFGLNWNQALEAGGVLVGDTVTISLEIQGVKMVAAPAST